MNQNRDGQDQHKIHAGKVNYWPNRFDSIKPATKPEGAYISWPEKVADMKQRPKSKKFRDYISQARLF